jgi:hypothetical protein
MHLLVTPKGGRSEERGARREETLLLQNSGEFDV